MSEQNDKKEEKLTLDGKLVTLEELNEAKKNTAVRIIEDKENPGSYKTLQHFKE